MADTATLTLTEFLLARIAHDEWEAGLTSFINTHGMWTARRVLAECVFKRRVVEGMRDGVIDDMFAPEILGAMATIYSDHPDYRDEWKP